jgi:TonB-linked SusC/RagA family outer membrane protein
MRRLLFFMLGMLLISAQLLAQNRTITGNITDAQGKAVSNVSVAVKGTSIGTSTGVDGSFSLSVPANAKTLVISSVGYQLQEVAIGSRSFISVSLVSANDQLTEVVVSVPYGTIKKKAFTGSETTVNSIQIQKQQVTSISRVLEGLVSGVITTNGGGAPGTNASILVRGVGSINATSGPLYVLNGIPYDGSISALSTDDIETVTVLKDAAAAALYGSRAANGVIMITTKKGKKGKPVVTASLRQGIMSRGIPEYNRVDTKQYYELFWEAYRNSYVFSQGASYAAAGVSASNVLTSSSGLIYNAYNVPGNTLVDPATGKLNPNAKLLWNESWEDAMFRNASRTNANINVSGAGENSSYYFSAGYLNEDGIVKFSGYNRYNLRLNIDASPKTWFNTGLNLDGAIAKRKDVPSGGTATTNPFYYTRQMGPIYPVYQHDLTTGAFIDTNGQHKFDFGVPTQMGTRPYAGNSNVAGTLSLDDRSSNILNSNATGYAEVKFLKDFSLKGTIGLNYYNSNNTSYQNNQYGDAAPATNPPATWGRSTKTFDRQLSLTGNEVLSWSHVFGVHNIRALAGHENYLYRYNVLTAGASGFLLPGQTELDNGSGPLGAASSREDNHRIESYFANVNYDYSQKYLFSASFRRDGSSRFAPDFRWGNFYSLGFGWRLSQEKFLSNVGWLNDLKLRASYGEQGNEDIGLYYQYENYYYANPGTDVTKSPVSYSPPTRPANIELAWEKNKTANAGFDFVVLDNRLSGTIEYFNRISDNLLFDVPLPTSTGFASVYQNIGTMKNYGVELQLGYNIIRGNAFNWRADVNLTSFKNKITKLPPTQEVKGIISGTKKLSVGHDIYAFWLPEYAGVDASNGDALYYMDVLDASGKPTSRVLTNEYNKATFYYHGSALPKISGGLTNSFNYKGFDLSFLLTFAYGGLFYDGNYASIMHRGSPGTAWQTDILQRWQKPGDVTVVPRIQTGISGQDGASTRWLVDGSYLNVKNITLSYSLSKIIINRLHVSGAQIFTNVDNAWLFTAKKGMDPQRAFTGTADATYTPFRTVSIGFNVNL